MTESNVDACVRGHHYGGVLLLSFATLLLELSLTRVLSVALWYHFGFLVISTAMLGFGTSGVVVAVWRWLRDDAPLDHALATLGILFGVLTVCGFCAMQRIPFDPLAVLVDRRQLLFTPAYYLTTAAPFFCSGLALALLFTRGRSRIDRLYAFDLVGAGIGCAALALVMPAFGGSGSVVIAAASGLAAAAMFAWTSAPRLAGAASLLCVAAVTLAFAGERALPITVTPLKVRNPFPQLLTAWNTFSRIDLFERPADPQTGAPAVRRFVFDAGTAATGMQDLRPGVRDYLSRHTDDVDYPSGVAYAGKERPSVLVLGSGAGAEVLDALHFGARRVTAVEVNPIINDVVSRGMSDFWGGLFQQPEVQLVTAEGRAFVRRSRETYDAIVSVHTISNAAVASGALALAENYVLTREAFEDYLDHLTPEGVIYFTRPEPQIARLFATAREALATHGVSRPAGHLYAFRERPGHQEVRTMGADRPAFLAGFLLKKAPFTAREIAQVEALLGVAPPSGASGAGSTIEVLYSPFAAPGESVYRSLLTAPDLEAEYRAHAAQLAPATDDRPFFNHTTRWSTLDSEVVRGLVLPPQLGDVLLGDRPVAELSLLVLLAQAVALAAVLILLPLARFSRAGVHAPARWSSLAYFAALGFGFITIEMTLLGRFSLFLGQPVHTYAVVLASLLVSTGIGSLLSGHLTSRPVQLQRIIVLLLLTLFLTAALIQPLFDAALGVASWMRLVLVVVVLSPLGVLLGMPFPAALRLVADRAPALVPWVWGVNGFFTVIGTVCSVIIAMTFGMTAALATGAGCYLCALGAIASASRVRLSAAGEAREQRK